MNKATLSKLLKQFENTARDDEMRGCQHPDDAEAIHEQSLLTRQRVVTRILTALNEATAAGRRQRTTGPEEMEA